MQIKYALQYALQINFKMHNIFFDLKMAVFTANYICKYICILWK